MVNQKCRAKNPQTCWKHGEGLGFEANRKIIETLNSDKHLTITTLLKNLDSEYLADNIVFRTKTIDNVDTEKVKEAILLAADLHKTDLRANRGDQEATPYIEHPLRNALRLMRLGCTNQTVIIGSILHDTVEDHPFELAKLEGVITKDEHVARASSFAYVKKTFGPAVEKMVKGMSNPINDDKYLPWQQKNINYSAHVEHAISDPEVFLGKVSDFTDNALSLHHTEKTMNNTGIYRRASKYLPVCDILTGRLLIGIQNKEFDLPDKSLIKIFLQLQDGKKRLKDLQKRYTPIV